MREPRVFFDEASNGWLVDFHQGLRPEVLAAVVRQAKKQIYAHLTTKFDSTSSIRRVGLERLKKLSAATIQHRLVPEYPWEQDKMMVNTENKPRLLGPAHRRAA